MPTKTTIATTATSAVSTAKARNWIAVTNHTAATTAYLALDGGTPTDADGATPGIPVAGGSTYSIGGAGVAGKYNINGAVSVHNPSAGNMVISVQEG